MPKAPATEAAAPVLTKKDFDKIRELAYSKFGLDLKEGKEGLVAARLGKKMRESQFDSFGDYYQSVLNDSTGESLIHLIDALATNHTSFLREPAHFTFLHDKILPELKSRSHVDIWCAAASTGEEPYTIAFSMLDAWGDQAANRVHIVSTDISTKALDQASRAVYPEDRFENLPQTWARRYLLRGQGRWEGWLRVKPEVRAMIEYRRLNLIEPFHHSSRFSVIFCRNVMIYFDKPTQARVVNKMAEWLEPGGYLFTGHAESLAGLQQPLQYIQPAVYRKKSS